MIRQLGFRRLLPIIFTLVHVVLTVCVATTEAHPQRSMHSEVLFRDVAFQEGTGIPMDAIEPRPLIPAMKVAVVLNLPAFFAGALVASVLLSGSELSLMYATSPFVLLLWYGIGRWLDGILGYRPPSIRKTNRWNGIAVLLSGGLLCLSILVVTPMNHHRTPDTYWMGTASILWSILLLSICVSKSKAVERRDRLL